MPNTQVRVVGSGFTTLSYRGTPIAWLESFVDSGQQPIAQPEPIFLLTSKFAREIATAGALNIGTLQARIKELWSAPVWQQLSGLEHANNIVDVYAALQSDPTALQCQMLIKPPGANYWRSKTYMNCVVTSIDDGENVTLETISLSRNITIWYTNTVYSKIAASA